LRRVRKRLKTKDRILADVGEACGQGRMGERQRGCDRGDDSARHETW